MRTAEAFWSHVEHGDGCWLWTGGRMGRNHDRGIVNWHGRPVTAYRVALLLVGREVAPGHSVHHLCEEPLCVRPDHLHVVATEREHRAFHRRTHCKRGHPLSGANLGVVGADAKNAGLRYCRACLRERARKRAQDARDERSAA